MGEEFGVPVCWLFFEFHVYFELQVADELSLDVELVVGQGVVPFELGPFPFVLVESFPDDEKGFLGGLGPGVVFLFLCERVDFGDVQVQSFLDPFPDFLLLLLVLLLGQLQDLLDGLVVLLGHQPEDISLANVLERVQVHFPEGVFLLAGHKTPLLDHQLVPD